MKSTTNVIRKLVICLLGAMMITSVSSAQETTQKKSPFSSPNKEKAFSPIIALELWTTYSMGEEKNGTKYANRLDQSFRRLRFGAKGQPYSWLNYDFELLMDRLGENDYAATKGSYGGIDLWKAYISINPLKDSQLLNIHAGYFWAVVSREFNTSPWAVGSFDKTRASWYLRNFVTGKGNGIVSGLALGGLKNYENFGISYRAGIYSPEKFESKTEANPLLTGRIMFSFGDQEQTTYKCMLPGNQWKKRNGVTIGFGGSSQGKVAVDESTFFDKSSSYGADILINYEGLRIDGEYYKMKKEASGYNDFEGTEWIARIGYSFILGGKYLEPVFTVDKYVGEGEKTLFKFIGDDITYDFGVNWYINKDKLKVSLHYLNQDGSTSSNVGDYLGLGFQFRI